VAAKKKVKTAAPTSKAKKKVKKAARTILTAAKKKAAAPMAASAKRSGIGEGEKAPAFELPDQKGQVVSSKELAGEPYVLYFYPKDDTPGCTREACGFRDEAGAFAKSSVRVIGVSPDKPESHARFADKYGLKSTLLSDREKTLAQKYGVWVKKQNYGREYMGIARSTFLVDKDGKVKKVWRSVKVDGHVDRVLEAARQLG
jgi:peroxiredoxin Q/BCP